MRLTNLSTPLLFSRPMGWATTTILLGVGIVFSTGCAGSSVGDSLQQSLEADPQLEQQGTLLGNSADDSEEETPRSEATDQKESPRDAADSPSAERNPLPPGEQRDSATNRANADGNATGRPNQTPQNTTGNTASGLSSGALADVPEDLKPYIEDLIRLQLFSEAETLKANSSEADVTFAPNQPITRGQYANWLLAANNLFYSDQPSQKIRPANRSATPAFQDVPASHPYFGAIQGLTEAGLIPSALTGNSTAVTFRPDAPLTRESLVLWKVPLDIRTALPTASVDAVKTTWGFQDAAEIEPLALRAVLADYQTGDFANILRAFGYTTLFQPQKAVTQAEAAATLWRFGSQTEGISASELLNRPEDEATSRS
jgi:hypothetical protein